MSLWLGNTNVVDVVELFMLLEPFCSRDRA